MTDNNDSLWNASVSVIWIIGLVLVLGLSRATKNSQDGWIVSNRVLRNVNVRLTNQAALTKVGVIYTLGGLREHALNKLTLWSCG